MWSFPKAGPEHSNSSSKLNEFFNDQDASTALVREAVQNSLDAALDPLEPVRVRLSLASYPWETLEPFLRTGQADETVDDHLSSDDLGKFADSFVGQELRCLIIEDQGTKGLIGETDKNNAHSGSNFVGFWWNDGISGKGKGSSGSHGVGKTTLTRISGMSLFLAVTKRCTDEKRYLLGFANLPYHHVNGRSYLGYGRFGRTIQQDGKDKFMPIEEASQIEEFLSEFSLNRDESGLSVFIPGVPNSVDSSGLLLAAVRDYYWPILKGDLVIEVVDRHSGETTTVSAENISMVVSQISEQEGRSRNAASDTEHRVGIVREILELRTSGNANWFAGNEPKLSLTAHGDIRGAVSKDCFSDDNLERMYSAFEKGQLIGFSFSLKIEAVGGEEQVGLVEVFFKKTDYKLTDNAQFIRNQIIISRQPSNIPAKNVTCFLIAEEQVMSDYLKEAEEPAHTRWFLNRFNEQKSFESDWALRFVMDLPAHMYRILSREDEDANTYENFADDIFSVTEPVGTGTKKKRGQKRKKSEEPDDLPAVKRSPAIRVERDAENPGFDLLPVGNLAELFEEENVSFPIEVTVKAAYVSALGKTRSWRDYSKIDFQFGKTIPIDISPQGAAKVVSASENTFTVELLQPEFRVSAKGFDGNRDLLIHPRIKL
ncbi:hypothetical protein RA27_16370 [Ruegeria sp. ANG-R]|uniref:hypothetical protein n=1 Tax=Ruegeria sp. ANG-R TaxID=1577903 RepID=UPI00057F9798|nr:hypothetical protein [Ruegeria sp. ANG-R]KIC39878.1 hypothetical protein RA27_16370 [Ruegeria sp. ANG-R]